METFEKALLLFLAKLKQSEKELRTTTDPQTKQNSHNSNPDFSFWVSHLCCIYGTMSSGRGGGEQASYWFINSVNTVLLACTATYSHTLVSRFCTEPKNRFEAYGGWMHTYISQPLLARRVRPAWFQGNLWCAIVLLITHEMTHGKQTNNEAPMWALLSSLSFCARQVTTNLSK